MSIESNCDGKKFHSRLTEGTISFEVKMSEKDQRSFELFIQTEWMTAIKQIVDSICKKCLFDKKCEDCPLKTVWGKTNEMQAKLHILAYEMKNNREEEEETK